MQSMESETASKMVGDNCRAAIAVLRYHKTSDEKCDSDGDTDFVFILFNYLGALLAVYLLPKYTIPLVALQRFHPVV